MSVAEFVAGQLRQPSGLAGRAFGPLLNRGNARMNRRAVERLELAPGQSVLDVGFGGGIGLRNALSAGAGFAAGIEISEPMLSQGRRRFRAEIASGRVELERAGVEAIPYESERFDRVLSSNTIYFWPDAMSGLREIRRVLKTDGRLVLATATVEAMKQRFYTRHGFAFFDEEDLRQLMTEAGFAGVTVEVLDTSIFTIGEN
jgi:SAM-dependent methyltransferase